MLSQKKQTLENNNNSQVDVNSGMKTSHEKNLMHTGDFSPQTSSNKFVMTSTNPLFATYEQAVQESSNYSVGENGMLQFNAGGLSSSQDPIKQAEAAISALSVALVRGDKSGNPSKGKRGIRKASVPTSKMISGVTRSSIIQLVQRASQACNNIPDEVARADYLRRLIVLAFNLRDIRGTFGKGERTLFHWMFIELYHMFPKTMLVLVHEIPNYGSWLDLNKLYELLHSEKHRYGDLMNEILTAYVTQILMDNETRKKNYSMKPHERDAEDKPKISLAARWVPKEGRATDRFTKMTKALARTAFPDVWEDNFQHALNLWRRMVTTLNREIHTTEQLMCAKEFSKINFRLVSGRCLNKFTKAWLDEDRKKARQHPGDHDRNLCREHYESFLKLVAKGKVSAKGKSMFVHEIANEVQTSWPLSEDRQILLEAQFKDHVDAIEKYRVEHELTGLGDSIAIVDVSGSMSGDPMGCAIAVGVIASHFNSEAWRDYVMTFTSTPTLVRLRYPRSQKEYDATKRYGGYSYYGGDSTSGNSVYSFLGPFDPRQANRELTWLEKLRVCSSVDWGMSTNFLKAIDCVTTTALAAGVQLPDRILTITDMQWDAASSSGDVSWTNDTLIGKALNKHNTSTSWKFNSGWDTGVEMIEAMLSRTTLPDGTPLKMPQMIFWNARGGHGGYAVQADHKNTAMVSGFSTSMLKVFLLDGVLAERSDPTITTWDTLEKVLSCEDYTQIRMLTVSVGEGPFRCLQAVYDGAAIHMPKTFGKTQQLVDSVQPKKKKAAATAVRAQVLSPPHSPPHPPETDSDSDSCSDMPPLVEGAAFSPEDARLDAVEQKVDGLASAIGGIQSMLSQLLARK